MEWTEKFFKLILKYITKLWNCIVLILILIQILDCSTDENAVRTACGPYCVYTCQRPRPPNTGCFDVCNPGCFCKRNFILDESTNKCVALNDCPKTA